MSRVVVTQELANTIKLIRQQNNIPSKNVAENIDKSSSYISRLESGQIKSIDSKLLDQLFELICGDNVESFELVSKLYETLTVRYSKEEIDRQIWFINYDTISRRIPIPSSLIQDINSKIQEHKISIPYLLSRINANESLSEEELTDDSIPLNLWYASGSDIKIKILLSLDEVEAILSRKKQSSSYTEIQAIVFYLFKIIFYGEVIHLEETDYVKVMENATRFLSSHKFYSLPERDKVLKSVQSDEQIKEVLNSIEIENSEIIYNILSGFKFASDTDVELTNEYLKALLKNFKSDLWFMLKIVSLNFNELEDFSITLKKRFISEINKLIDTYKEIPSEKKKQEIY